MPIFFLIFVLIPVLEISVFILVGNQIGLLATVAIILTTALIGATMLRHQGLSVLRRAQKTLDEGGIPVESVIDGIGLLLAGAFLITPGLITDVAGFTLLVAPLRRKIAHYIIKYAMKKGALKMSTYQNTTNHGSQNSGQTKQSKNIIDAEYENVDPHDPQK